MTREELQRDFEREQMIGWMNSQGEPDIDYVMWLEEKILSLPPAEGAEAILKNNACLFQEDPFTEMYIGDKDAIIKCINDAIAREQPTAEGASDLCKHEPVLDIEKTDIHYPYFCAKCNCKLKEVGLSKQQPTAEGAEEILKKYRGGQSISMEGQKHKRVWFSDAIAAMHEFATLHAQKIADKMVSERLIHMTHRCNDLENMLWEIELAYKELGRFIPNHDDKNKTDQP